MAAFRGAGLLGQHLIVRRQVQAGIAASSLSPQSMAYAGCTPATGGGRLARSASW